VDASAARSQVSQYVSLIEALEFDLSSNPTKSTSSVAVPKCASKQEGAPTSPSRISADVADMDVVSVFSDDIEVLRGVSVNKVVQLSQTLLNSAISTRHNDAADISVWKIIIKII